MSLSQAASRGEWLIGREEGCASCIAAAEEISDGLLTRLGGRDTSFATVSHVPLSDIERYKASRGWEFPWYSSFDSDFNSDFHTTREDSVEGARLFHSYSMFARRTEVVGSWCYWLDLTACGEQRAPGICQQQAQHDQSDDVYDRAPQQQQAGGIGDVIVEHGEVAGHRVGITAGGR